MTTPPLRSVSSSERLYRALLWLYPTQFRRTYGREMLLTFRDCYREEQEHTRLWGLVLSDLVTSVCIEHWKASITFFKSLLGLEVDPLYRWTLVTC